MIKTQRFLGGDTGMPRAFMLAWDGTPFTGKSTIMHLHSASVDWWTGVAQVAGTPIHALASAGFLVIAPDCAQLWGNDGASDGSTGGLNMITKAADYAKNTLGASNKVAIYGRSMGCANGVNWCSRNTARVCGLAFDSGALDLAFDRGTDASHGPFYATINSVYGISTDAQYASSVKTQRNPIDLAAGAALAKPHLIGGWTTDTFVGNDSATNGAYIAALNGGASVFVHHTRTGTSHTGTFDDDPSDVTAFMQSLTFT